MAVHGGDEVQVLQVSGFDIVGTRTEFDITVGAGKEKTTCLGQTWEQFAAVTPYNATVKTQGFYSDASHSINAELVTLSGSKRTLIVTPAGNTLGATFIGVSGIYEGNYQRVLKIGALHKANADLTVSGPVEPGVLLFPNGGITASPLLGSVVDNGASSAFGASGYISLSALSLGGYSSLTVVIQTSPDNVTFTDKITLGSISGNAAGARVFVSGTIDRYAKLRWQWNGAGAGPTATLVAGLARLTSTQASV